MQVPVWDSPLTLTKPENVQLSKVTTGAFMKAVTYLKMTESAVKLRDLFPRRSWVAVRTSLETVFQHWGIPISRTTPYFEWGDESEHRRVNEQMEYLRDVLQLDVLSPVGVYFTTELPIVSFPIRANGSLIYGKADILLGISRNLSFVVFEIKKAPASWNPRLSCCETVAYAKVSKHPILHVMTNLREKWQLRWVKSAFTICTLDLERSQATVMIRYFYLASLHAGRGINTEIWKDFFNAGFRNGGDGSEGGGGGEVQISSDWFGRATNSDLKFGNESPPPAAGSGDQDAVLTADLGRREQLRELQKCVEAQVDEDFKYIEKDEWTEEDKAKQREVKEAWLFADTVASVMEAQRQGVSYPELLEMQPRLNDFQQPSNEKKVRNFLSEPEHKIDSPH